MKTAELIKLAANENGVSIYKIGKMLGYNDNRIYSITKGRKTLPEKDLFQVCEWANVDPIIVLPELLAERTTKPEFRAAWERIATLVTKAAGTSAALFIALSLTLAPVPAEASFNITQTNNIHYAQFNQSAFSRFLELVLSMFAKLWHSATIRALSTYKNN